MTIPSFNLVDQWEEDQKQTNIDEYIYIYSRRAPLHSPRLVQVYRPPQLSHQRNFLAKGRGPKTYRFRWDA
jgi:hypothetical protein